MGLDMGLVILSLVLGLVVAPVIYVLALASPFKVPLDDLFDSWIPANIWLNAGANVLVMLASIRLTGPFDRRLAAVLTRTLIVHGTLGFVLLVTRAPHSNQVMLIAAAASPLLGVLVASIKSANVVRRVALLGPWHPLAKQIRGEVDWFETPPADMNRYEVLVTVDVTRLDPEWTNFLARSLGAGTRIQHLAEFVEETQGLVSIDHFHLDHVPAGSLTSYRIRKRLLDILLVVLTLPIALPLIAVASLAILLVMGRPILFKQSRVGLGGQPFLIFKLRTMNPGPTGVSAATQGACDPRVTPLGRVLRRFRIDELPQIWNVLKGDMSIIGPRPEWTLLSEQYTRAVPAYAYRHLVRPGISGWAQVRGGYAADVEETRTKVGYDLFYIKNLSFSLDMQILIRTIWTLLSGFGAR